MPVVNIRDDDGNIQDVVNIPISNGGGGGGDVLEEAKAYADKLVVEVSPYCDAIGEGEHSNFQWWEWKKYADGTFVLHGEMYGWCGEEGYEDFTWLPFDIYYMTSSYSIVESYSDYWQYVDFNIDANMLEDRYSGELILYAHIDPDKFNEFCENEPDGDLSALLSVTLTGRWREKD